MIIRTESLKKHPRKNPTGSGWQSKKDTKEGKGSIFNLSQPTVTRGKRGRKTMEYTPTKRKHAAGSEDEKDDVDSLFSAELSPPQPSKKSPTPRLRKTSLDLSDDSDAGDSTDSGFAFSPPPVPCSGLPPSTSLAVKTSLPLGAPNERVGRGGGKFKASGNRLNTLLTSSKAHAERASPPVPSSSLPPSTSLAVKTSLPPGAPDERVGRGGGKLKASGNRLNTLLTSSKAHAERATKKRKTSGGNG
ncbi:hypothetical protein TrRE_jg5020, partial [Triparma retinervis]